MPPWVWELFLLAPLALLGGRFLRRLFDKLAPRYWGARNLPPAVGNSIETLGGEVIPYLILVGIGLVIFGIIASTGPAWLANWAPLIVLLLLISSIWGIYSLVYFKYWWVLEPGCPLRENLDALSQRTGIFPRRVRLRESNGIQPRVFLNGSLELTTGFFAILPDDEQIFLLAAVLQQRHTHQGLKRIGRLLVVLLMVSVLIAGIRFVWLKDTVPFMLYLIPLQILISSRFHRLPEYSKQTLQYALEITGDLEAAERAMRRVDPVNATRQLAELDTWWQSRQRSMSPVVVAPVSNSSQMHQTLGRNP